MAVEGAHPRIVSDGKGKIELNEINLVGHSLVSSVKGRVKDFRVETLDQK